MLFVRLECYLKLGISLLVNFLIIFHTSFVSTKTLNCSSLVKILVVVSQSSVIAVLASNFISGMSHFWLFFNLKKVFIKLQCKCGRIIAKFSIAKMTIDFNHLVIKVKFLSLLQLVTLLHHPFLWWLTMDVRSHYK